MSKLIFNSNDMISKYVLHYIYTELNLNIGEYNYYDKINNCEYINKGKIKYSHLINPINGEYKLKYNNKIITIIIKDLIINNTVQIINNSKKFLIIKEITLSIEEIDNNFLNDFIIYCNEIREKYLQDEINSLSNKINKKFYTKYGWCNSTLIPKRNMDTIFLKKNQKEDICNVIQNFINPNTYNDYLKHGIPYKYNILMHGKPGVGKTTLIHGIATKFNCDILVLNVNAELKESDFLEAFRSINDTEKLNLIVIEDIDCIFTDRKNNDSLRNNITMQGFLNCMDGFNTQEGSIVILTTNNPDKLDNALKRSGRIDYSIELTYVNKEQAENIYKSFFNDNNFNKFWDHINKFDIPPCILIDYLFMYRNQDILSNISILIEKLKKNNLEDNVNKNLYN